MTVEKKDHFFGKSVREHMAEEQAKNLSFDVDGSTLQGKKNSFFEAMRDTVLLIGALYFLLLDVALSQKQVFVITFSFGMFLCFWRGFRSAIQSWTYLKRMHRIAYEERCEILANREQEREELLVLYQDKGLSGPLLERVVDVLMADHERLLQVMLQEELGLKLISIDHPLHTAFWVFLGSLVSLFISLGVLFMVGPNISWVLLSVVAGLSSSILSYKEKHIQIRAFVWTTASAVVAFQVLFLVLRHIL